MQPFIPLLIVVFGVGTVVWVLKEIRPASGRKRAPGPQPLDGVRFERRDLLVNASERRAFEVLRDAPLGHAYVFPEVRLEDVAQAVTQSDKARITARNRIKARHLDFVLVDEGFRPLLAVEVDGASHRGDRSREVDELKEAALSAAGIPLLRLHVGQDWSREIGRFIAERA